MPPQSRSKATESLTTYGNSFVRVFAADVERYLQQWSPERLGGLAALGRGVGAEVIGEELENFPGTSYLRFSLHDVRLGERITDGGDGYTLLRRVAAYTVVAAMLDIACARVRERGGAVATY